MISYEDWEENIAWNLVKDALYNLSPESGASFDRARGTLVGVVSGLQAVVQHATSDPFSFVWNKILPMFPKDFRIECIPPSWLGLNAEELTIDLKKVVSFKELMDSLPEDQADLVKDKALGKYLWEISRLQQYSSLCKGRPVAYFYPFQECGSQFIANFGVNDIDLPVEGKINWHGRDTSQWVYAGGMLVQDGRVSLHH